MDNKVVHTLARTLQEVGVPTIRFNFRGVGASTGVHDEGRGECDDAAVMAEWGAERWPGARLTLAGFSFGAYVAIRSARISGAERLIAVAPPVTRFGLTDVPGPPCPWLLVQGDADEVVDPQAVIEWGRRQDPAPQLAALAGADHFFNGRLHELRAATIDFAR